MRSAKKNRVVILFLAIASLAVLYNGISIYDQLERIRKLQQLISYNQSDALSNFVKAFRATYQERFLQLHIPLNERNIKLLPVSTMSDISRKFSDLVAHKAIVKTVSDRPRNPANRADSLEKEALDYFRSHPKAKEMETIFSRNGDEIFFYASPLYIEKRCLKCHGKREDAPLYIRTHYDTAYNYKLGDLRGIIAIYLSENELKKSIKSLVYRNIYVTVAITVLFLILFFFILKKAYRKEMEYTADLEKEVEKKTQALEKKSKQLEYQLYHDLLTRLPNRNALILDIAKKNASALILINIDDFKEINDFYGHDTGDRLIKELSQLLERNCPPVECSLYRMPSDEFALLVLTPIAKPELERFIKHLIQVINDHNFKIDENAVHLRIAVGASLDRDELLITADMAIKKAKAERKDYVIFDNNMDLSHKYKQNIEWAEKLKKAIEEDRIIPYYQPIVSAQDGKIVSYEALIRIVDENGTVHTPYQFLDIAKRTKYYASLTHRMADKIFDRFQNLPYDVSLNISYLDIVNKETMAYLLGKFSDFSDPGRIHFEILESEGIERYDEVYECLKKIRTLGANISLDDFGSGYSNFEHILKLEVDMLKIDGSLIKNIDTDIGSQIIVETIVDFAKKLNIDTCAEFVSSKAIYDTVREMGVTYVQGYYISEPKPEIPEIDRYEL
ncbi:EAL domain-containing protein [Hydrogenimonas sp. SS33]|uniref:EAL domain-containing protein n=1 Tax=Hydrogenimonas leucolamina TaxID=2954236 RepID=UPI00336C2D09